MRKLRTIEMKRLSVEEYHEAEKTPLIVILDDVRSMHNVGSVFRTADAFRLEAVYLCGITKTALEAVEELKGRGVTVYSIEQAEGSTKLPEFKPEPGKPYAIVMGNEVKGVHQEVIDASNGCLEIPQYGTKHSMNVSVTAGIVIWHFVNSQL